MKRETVRAMPNKTLTLQTLSEQTGASGEEVLNRFEQTAVLRGPAEEVVLRWQVTVISKSQPCLWIPLDKEQVLTHLITTVLSL